MEHSQVEIVAVDDEASFWDDRSDLLACRREDQPRVPAYFGYDALGSDLFEAITELPTYYLTRVEHGLLLDRICTEGPALLTRDGMLLLVHSAVCDDDTTVSRLADSGLDAEVLAR